MTGPRSERSAVLLVGSTPSTVTNVQRAGQILSRLLANLRWCLVFVFLGPACSSSVRSSVWIGGETAAVLVFAEAGPGCEEAGGQLEALLAEGLLGGESFGVTAEVALGMAPADLAAEGVEMAVGPAAVRAADPGEVLPDQLAQTVTVAISRDPEHRRPRGGRGRDRALLPGGRPAGLVEVDRRRLEHRGDQRFVRLQQSGSGALTDRVDRADRETNPEQLTRKL